MFSMDRPETKVTKLISSRPEFLVPRSEPLTEEETKKLRCKGGNWVDRRHEARYATRAISGRAVDRDRSSAQVGTPAHDHGQHGRPDQRHSTAGADAERLEQPGSEP